MSQGRATPKAAPVGWVFLDQHRRDGITIRWRRGDPIAYVLSGQRLGDHSTTGVIATIPVPPVGWTDHTDIRHLAQRWHPQH